MRRIRFSTPLEPETASDESAYAVYRWNYRWSDDYGSGYYSVRNPELYGEDPVQVESVYLLEGGHVIRYNEISSTEGHGFNDGIGGGQNYSFVGNMYRDSDIYGNLIRNVWDDAIESEGSNMNVRIWGNYIEKYFVGVATAATTKGPIYMFRNNEGNRTAGKRIRRKFYTSRYRPLHTVTQPRILPELYDQVHYLGVGIL